ncbi:MAG TPA: hypothetical protein VN634_00750 [Candidatus Limnocylindrales bacterium]|nr:hypothetical protein [Candidatus Limnocylindrales bacterium]
MLSGREIWQFEVKEIPGGDYCLCPEPREEPHRLARAKQAAKTVLDSWHINFVLPSGTDFEDAQRIAELLNEWVREVTCTARVPAAEACDG